MDARRTENGQALVFLIIVMIGILGLSALAIDGSMLYAERRQAQSAADAAAMAAGLAGVKGGNINNAAMKMIHSNGYTIDNDPAINPTLDQDVQVNHPPVSGPYALVSDKNDYYQIIIRQKVKPILSQFVFSGKLEISVESVVHARGNTTISGNNAFEATGENICPGIVFNGGSNTVIEGGNIFSNSNGHDTNGTCGSGVSTGSSGSISVTGGNMNLAGTWIGNAGFSISPRACHQPTP